MRLLAYSANLFAQRYATRRCLIALSDVRQAEFGMNLTGMGWICTIVLFCPRPPGAEAALAFQEYISKYYITDDS